MALSPAVPQTRALVLGSTSVYRRELLSRLRLPFSTEPPHVDESPLAHETPERLARRLAAAKAAAVARLHPGAVVIGSDQVADLDGEPLGKPGTHANAVVQLRRMSGRTVIFQTALTVMCEESGFVQHDLAPVRVRFRDLDAAEIEAYLRAEQPYDCAGSARSMRQVRISGSPTSAVGSSLSIASSRAMPRPSLRAAGLRVF